MSSPSLQLALFQPNSPTEVDHERFQDIPLNDTISIDLETCDPSLSDRGPGGIRGEGHVAGISIASLSLGISAYYPIAHFNGGNIDRANTIRYFQTLLSRRDIKVVGANFLYDVEWLSTLSIPVLASAHDVQIRGALLDENRTSYSLDSLSKLYGGRGKDEELLRDAAKAFGVDSKSGMWKLHANYVSGYARRDAEITLEVFLNQQAALEAENLLPVYEMEVELLPIIWEMRKKGVPINEDYASQLCLDLGKTYKVLLAEVSRINGGPMDVWSNKSIANALRNRGYDRFPRTAKGNPSFTADWMEDHAEDDELLQLIVDARGVDRNHTFVKSTVLGSCYKGRIHAEFKQSKDELTGTRTGRFSCQHPNLQQIPSRDKTWAKKIRSCFVPEHGKWAKLDYSQQEPRILVHLAALLNFPGAPEMRQRYVDSAATDFYTCITDLAAISRRQAKDLTLGRFYGMGIKKMAEKLGCDQSEAASILATFDNAAPFIKKIANYADAQAAKRGWVKTLLGRRRHFNEWTSAHDFKAPVMSKEAAIEKYGVGGIRRADTRKALNAVIQGSAADMVKAAIIKVRKELSLVPHLTVHDELGFSVENMEQSIEIKMRMEDAIKMTVPVKCDLTLGDHWS